MPTPKEKQFTLLSLVRNTKNVQKSTIARRVYSVFSVRSIGTHFDFVLWSHLNEAHEVAIELCLGHGIERDRIAHGSFHRHLPCPMITSNANQSAEGSAS